MWRQLLPLLTAVHAADPVTVSRDLQDPLQFRVVSVGVVAPNFATPTRIAHVGDLEATVLRARVLTVIPTEDGSYTSWGAVGLRLPPYASTVLQPYVMAHPMTGMLEADARITPLDELAVDLQGAYNPTDGAAWGAALLNLGDMLAKIWEFLDAPHFLALGTVGLGADTRGMLALRGSAIETDIKGSFLTALVDLGAEMCTNSGSGLCLLWLSALPVGVRLPPAASARAWIAYKFHWLPLAMGSGTGVHTLEGNLDLTKDEPFLMMRLALDVGEGVQRRPVRTATLSMGYGTSH